MLCFKHATSVRVAKPLRATVFIIMFVATCIVSSFERERVQSHAGRRRTVVHNNQLDELYNLTRDGTVFRSDGEALAGATRCDSLVVRTVYGLQSANLHGCKMERSDVDFICLPLCGARSFDVGVARSANDDEVLTLQVPKCKLQKTVDVRGGILVIFRMTRIMNGFHLYHVLNNFVVNLDPNLLDKYVFYCWGCSVEFSSFFDKVLNVNARMVNTGCYDKYIFLGEQYTTYNVARVDKEKSQRWRSWAHVFKNVWCPSDKLAFDDRYFTLLNRIGAQNGRNMNGCSIPETAYFRTVEPTFENFQESSRIFCNSRLILSAEGNGLTNMLLLPLQSVVVVLWQSNRQTATLEVIYGNMAKLLGITMIAIPVESDDDLNVNCSAQLKELFTALF